MADSYRQTALDELPQVADLLQRVFQPSAGSQLLDPAVLHWKFHQPHPYWTGSRSYALEAGDSLSAHVAAWPFALWMDGRPLRCWTSIDWASDRRYPGGGGLIAKYVMKSADLSFGIGGTQHALRALPLLGYKRCGPGIPLYARPARPWKANSGSEDLGWKRWARLARDSAWALQSPSSLPGGWSVERIAPEALPESLFPRNDGALVRSADLLRYYLSCPAVPFHLISLRRKGEIFGYFLMSEVQGQARIVDLQVNSDDTSDWEAGYLGAVQTALSLPSTLEIMAAPPAGRTSAQEALLTCGFRAATTIPVFIVAAGDQIASLPLDLQMLATDIAFFASSNGE